MLKRTVVKYDKSPPNLFVEEYDLNCTADEMKHLFEIEDDYEMVFCYEIRTKEQIEFFQKKGFNIDRKEGYFFVEAYEED